MHSKKDVDEDDFIGEPGGSLLDRFINNELF